MSEEYQPVQDRDRLPRFPEKVHHGDGMAGLREPEVDTNPLGPFIGEETALSPRIESPQRIDSEPFLPSSFKNSLQQVVDSATANRTRKLSIAVLAACFFLFVIAGTLMRKGSGGGGEMVPPEVQAAEPVAPQPASSRGAYLVLLAQADSLQDLARTHFLQGDSLEHEMTEAEAANVYRQMLEEWPGDSLLVTRLTVLGAARDGTGAMVSAGTLDGALSGTALDGPSMVSDQSLALARAYLLQGDSLYALEEWDVALRKYQVAQEYLPDDPHVADMLAQIEERRALSIVEAQIARYVTRGQSMFNVKNYSEARRAYELALDLKPDDPLLLASIAQVDSFLVEVEGVERQFLYLKGQGDGLFDQGSFSAAMVSYEAAQALRPNDAFLKERIAAIQDSLNRLDRSSARQEGQYALYRARGDSLYAASDLDGAIEQYQTALAYKVQDAYVEERLDAIRSAQSEEEAYLRDENGVFIMPETLPELLNEDLIISGVKYPRDARVRGIEGLVVVRMIVDEEGRVLEPFIAKGIGFGCDLEALRVIENARFKPATFKGESVAAWYNHPIVFKLVR
jgi:TonB family protein